MRLGAILQVQNVSYHDLHLMFFGSPVSGYSTFDREGSVLEDRNPGIGGSENHYAFHLPELKYTSKIGEVKLVLNSSDLRGIIENELLKLLMNCE
jgi:hypothetical protein